MFWPRFSPKSVTWPMRFERFMIVKREKDLDQNGVSVIPNSVKAGWLPTLAEHCGVLDIARSISQSALFSS